MNLVLRNCRVTFQRRADAKFFHGWVTDITDEIIMVFAKIDSAILPSQEFHFHVFGHDHEFLVEATYSTSSIRTLASSPLVSGAYFHAEYQFYTFDIKSSGRSIAATHCARFRVDGHEAQLLDPMAGFPEAVQLLDISCGGAGVMGMMQHQRHEVPILTIPGHGGEMTAACEIRYSIPMGDEGMYRTGLMFRSMDRISKGRFDTLWKSLVELNTVRISTPTPA